MNCPIDEKIYQELRKVLNETEIFCCEKEYLKLYNLGYALLERVEKCAAYVNEHIEPPSTDEEFFLILMYLHMPSMSPSFLTCSAFIP